MGSKGAHFTCSGTPNGLGSFLEKHIFDPFLTHFLSQNSPFSRYFGILGGPKRATTSSKRAKNTWFGIPCGPGSFFRTRWTLLTHFGTHLFGLPLAACRSSLGLGTGVRALVRANFEGWKPPTVGGCRWIRCDRNRVLSHVAQDMVCFWFGAARGQGVQLVVLSRAFWGRFADIL